jgi:hypothetical protein
MELFKDISNFDSAKDYLPILNGALNAVLLLMFFVLHNWLSSSYLRKWYKTFHLSAIIENVITLMIIIIGTRFIYKYLFHFWNIILFTIVASILMIIYDIIFYLMFMSVPKGYSAIIDFFKQYKTQMGYKGIFINILMIIFVCLTSSYFATLNKNMNVITLITTLFFIPYLLYMK